MSSKGSRRRGGRRTPSAAPPRRDEGPNAAPGVAGLPWWLLPALVVVTLGVYAPAWHGGVLWDDKGHLTAPALQSLAGLWRIWFDLGATQQYYPAVHSAFWVMHRLWGDDTLGYHLVNIVLHAGSAWMLACVLRRIGVGGAMFAAFLFALHPVQVESVAWMTELKNVLSGACYLGAAWTYLCFDTSRRRAAYASALGLFTLAILSKTVTATLPAALLVVFWWQRGRLSWRRDVLPLVPFFVLGLGGGVLTAWVEHTYIGAQGVAFQITPIERILIAGRAIWFYLMSVLWPVHLVFIYPRWAVSQAVWWQYLFPLGVVALVLAAWAWRRRARGPLAVLLYFIGTLVPALGFVNVYPFRFSFVADHFQYLACIGVLVGVAAGLRALADRRHLAPRGRVAAAAAVLTVLGAMSWRQSREYVDAATLYRTTLEQDPDNWFAHNNLAALLLNGSHADVEEAAAHLREAVRLKPDDYPEAHYNLGLAFEKLGQFDAAAGEYGIAAAQAPAKADAHRRLAEVDVRLGRAAAAVQEFQVVLRLDPADPAMHNDLAGAWLQLGRFDEAVAEARTAVSLEAASPDAHYTLGVALARLGQLDAALAEFTTTTRLRPDDAAAELDAGLILLGQGRAAAAAERFRAVLRLRPGDPAATDGLARALK